MPLKSSYVAPCEKVIDEHGNNSPMQYTAIFHGCRNGNFFMKKCDIFHISAQNIEDGYTLEPPRCGGANDYTQSMF